MNPRRIGIRISAVALGCVIVACSPEGIAVGPSGSPSASAPALSLGDPTAAAASASASPSDVPMELGVTCTGSATKVATPRVRARPDGFHIRLTNTSGQALQFELDEVSGLPLLGDEVPAAGGTFVYTLGTGGYRLECGGGTQTAFVVVDPDGLYTPAKLACGNSGTTGISDYGEDAWGPKGRVLDVARMDLRGLEPGDIVERAGYPASDGDQLVRVVRHDQVVAIVAYADDGHGGWLVGTTRTCPGARITVETP